MWLKRSQSALSVHWREEVSMENKRLFPKDLNYLNVPYSIIDQRWFRSEKAVRAWFFYAWHALFPECGKSVIKTIRKEKFNLKQGEMICTRSYLAKSLGIEDSAAKSSTDRLKRTGTIKVKQEIISKDIEKAPKNKLSRITVDGVPVPNEPYIKMPLPIKADLFWQEKVLAQIYIYIMCKAEHKEVFGIGTGHSELLLKAGDVLTSYATLIEDLRCTEYQVKKYLSYFEKNGIITRQRVGNGILVHMNYYPQPKVKPAEKDKAEELLQLSTKSTTNHQSVSQQGQSVVAQRTVSSSPTLSPSVEKLQNNVGEEFESSNSSKIVQTPITEAVSKYFFGRKRGTKDVEVLNELIKDLSEQIKNNPFYCPVTNYIDVAMDEYLKLHEKEYPSAKPIYKFISSYIERYREEYEREQDRKYKEREAKRAQEYKESFHSWAYCAERVYEEYKRMGYLPHKLTVEHLWGIRWVLLGHKNFKGYAAHYQNLKDYEPIGKGDTKPRPDGYDNKAKGLAISIEGLFDAITAKELHSYFTSKMYSYEEYYHNRKSA